MKAIDFFSPIGGAVMWVSTAKVWWRKVVVGGGYNIFIAILSILFNHIMT